MNITVTFAAGAGTASRTLPAYDAACAVTVSGLSLAGSNYLYLTTREGAMALATRALISANVATLNLNNTTIQSFIPATARQNYQARLTVRNISSGAVIGTALVEIEPTANPNADVTRVGVDFATKADIADLQNQIDLLEAGAVNIEALTARTDAITDATLFAVQEEPEEEETTEPEKATGAQVAAWLAAKYDATGTAAGAVASHVSNHPAPTTRDSRNEAAGVAASTMTAHTDAHPAPTNRDTRNEAADAAIQSHITGTGSPHTPAGVGAYRAQTPASAAEVTGAGVAPDFANNLTLQWTLTGNVTSLAAATNLADGESGMILATLGAYGLPADPPSGAYKGTWTVTGTLVRILIERVGSTYLWSADRLTVVA